MRRQVLCLPAFILAATAAQAQNYSGTFTAVNPQGQTVTVILKQSQKGLVTGSISNGEMKLALQGTVDDDLIDGFASGDGSTMYFEAEIDGNELYLFLMNVDAQGNPDVENGLEMVLTATTQGGALANSADPAGAAGGAMGGATAGAPNSPAGGQGMSDGTPAGNEWAQWLAGKKVTYMDSYSSGNAGGYSMRMDIFLCSSGEFLYKDESSVSVDVGGAFGNAGGQGQNTGRWRIITQGQLVGIELRYSDGRVEQYQLQYQDGATYVNGERWYVTAAEICQ